MAILQKIRNHSGLLLGAIGLALLAFIIQDLFTKGSRSFSEDVGSINGKDISFDDFRVKVANLEKSGQNMTAVQAANQVWDQEVAITLLSDQFEKAGITVSEKHIIDVLSKNPQIGQNPQFLNELGKFDLKKFQDFFKANPEMAKNLEGMEKDADINAKYMIYSTLVKSGFYTTTAEGKFKYELDQNKVNFDYVAVPFSTIKDSDIKVTDEDINEYVKKHPKRFKSEGTREIEYVVIEDKPSAQDMDVAKTAMMELLNGKDSTQVGFSKAANVYEFVAENSDKPLDTTYVTKQQLNPEVADALYNLAVGQIYGPYVDGKYYAITKMLGKKAGAKAKASHILIAYEGSKAPAKQKRTKEEAKAKAEDLLKQAQANPGSFMMLALTNSDDSSAQNGGDLGTFGPGQMVKPFNDFVFNNPVGKIGLVETEFGFHVINVTGKEDAVKLATVSKKTDPSQATMDEAYKKASQFEMDAVAGKKFEDLAKKGNLTVAPPINAKPMDENFGAAGNQRQIVKWAYEDDTKIGNVKRFEVPNLGFIIAKLKAIHEKGLMSAEEAKPMVEMIIKNQKKAEKLISKMKGSSLDAIAKANNVTVQNVPAASIDNPSIPAGYEPKVVGTAIGTAKGKNSAPVEGNTGVYVVRSNGVTKAAKPANYDEYIKRVKGMASQAAGSIIPTLKNAADITDNRAKFY